MDMQTQGGKVEDKMTKNQLSRHATVLGADDAGQYVQYHATRIVHWNDRTVILRSGGWWTVTTKRKMNQASQQFGLGFNVSQKDFAWLVTLPNGNTVPFVEGMRFPRPAATPQASVTTMLDVGSTAASTKPHRDLAVRSGAKGHGSNARGGGAYPHSDWQYEVANKDTKLGYADWVAHSRERDAAMLLI